jgi:hypothetical protein
MGLIDFIKDAGELIFGQGKATPSADANAESAASAALAKSVTDLGIPIENLSVQVKGDVATVSGAAKSQADREKVVLAVGNTKASLRSTTRYRLRRQRLRRHSTQSNEGTRYRRSPESITAMRRSTR